MRRNIKAKLRSAKYNNDIKINACQIRRGDEHDIWIAIDRAVFFYPNEDPVLEIVAKCCHCWNITPNIIKKVINRKILEKTVENIQIRTKKLKNGAILIY
jgi:hypothetical protein